MMTTMMEEEVGDTTTPYALSPTGGWRTCGGSSSPLPETLLLANSNGGGGGSGNGGEVRLLPRFNSSMARPKDGDIGTAGGGETTPYTLSPSVAPNIGGGGGGAAVAGEDDSVVADDDDDAVDGQTTPYTLSPCRVTHRENVCDWSPIPSTLPFLDDETNNSNNSTHFADAVMMKQQPNHPTSRWDVPISASDRPKKKEDRDAVLLAQKAHKPARIGHTTSHSHSSQKMSEIHNTKKKKRKITTGADNGYRSMLQSVMEKRRADCELLDEIIINQILSKFITSQGETILVPTNNHNNTKKSLASEATDTKTLINQILSKFITRQDETILVSTNNHKITKKSLASESTNATTTHHMKRFWSVLCGLIECAASSINDPATRQSSRYKATALLEELDKQIRIQKDALVRNRQRQHQLRLRNERQRKQRRKYEKQLYKQEQYEQRQYEQQQQLLLLQTQPETRQSKKGKEQKRQRRRNNTIKKSVVSKPKTNYLNRQVQNLLQYQPQARQEIWDANYMELVKYKEETGGCCDTILNNEKLARWVTYQRKLYGRLIDDASAKPNSLSQDRIDLLNDIGFHWREDTERLPIP